MSIHPKPLLIGLKGGMMSFRVAANIKIYATSTGWELLKQNAMSLAKKFNIEDVKKAYYAGFAKNSEIANERLNSWHWQQAKEAFKEWLEKEFKGVESVKR